jgi:4-hydroxybenzoate polyprenyltransferase
MSATGLRRIGARIDAYEKLIRLDKPIGILLLLWPTLWAIWISSRRHPNEWLVWIFILGTALMRSAGCAVNDWRGPQLRPRGGAHARAAARRRHDRARGRRSSWPPVLALGAFALVLFFNPLTIALSVIGLAIAIIYPFTKRFFSLPQAWLGSPSASASRWRSRRSSMSCPPLAWALVLANFFWVMAYDTEYAMVDRDDDRRIGIRTSAILFGRFDVAIVMACYALFLAGMAGIGWWLHYGLVYYAAVAVCAVIAVYHYTLIREPEPRGLLQGLSPQQLDRRRALRGHRRRRRQLGEALRMILVIYAHPYPTRSRACAALLAAIRRPRPRGALALRAVSGLRHRRRRRASRPWPARQLVVFLHPFYWYSAPRSSSTGSTRC